METTFGANAAPVGVRARGRSFQEGEFHSPTGSEKVWALWFLQDHICSSIQFYLMNFLLKRKLIPLI
jgi:hypothetical protein